MKTIESRQLRYGDNFHAAETMNALHENFTCSEIWREVKPGRGSSSDKIKIQFLITHNSSDK